MTQLVLAVDGGKTATRLRLYDGATVAGETVAPALAGGGDGVRVAARVLQAALLDLPSTRTHDAAVLALTTCPADEAARRELLAVLGGVLSARRLIVCEDVLASHAGALGGPGVVLAAGTGSVTLAVDSDGAHRRRDGWGPDLGDRGSGFSIGRDGLRAAFAAHDACGPPTRLLEAAARHLGGLDLASAQDVLGHPDRVSRIALFAQHVVALGEGDPVAAQICATAADDLARTVRATAAASTGPVAVSWAGRLLAEDTVLRRQLLALLSEPGASDATALVAHPPRGDSLDGARQLATPSAQRLYGWGCTSLLTGQGASR